MTDEPSRPYASPRAFRQALTDRLRVMASEDGRWPLADLQRQFAYDRLLVRLYLLDDNWILKGSTALLARRIAVRHTVDIDVYRAVSREQAERDLRTALALDGGDWFTFEAGPARTISDGANGTRVPINARIGTTAWCKFHVDVVADGVRMTGDPDDVPAMTAMTMPDLLQPGYRAYPLLDHIADKVCAIVERPGPAQRPSTRYKDLVDLVTLIANARPGAEEQRRALVSESARRNLALPAAFDVPDPVMWEPGYAAEARRARLPDARTLTQAMAQVRPFLNPLLDDTPAGTWSPETRTWAPNPTPTRVA